MYAIRARFDGVNFKPLQPIPVNEDYEVVITFIKPVKKNSTSAKEVKNPRSMFIGLFEGQVWMSDDFNEPLDEFEEYMK